MNKKLKAEWGKSTIEPLEIAAEETALIELLQTRFSQATVVFWQANAVIFGRWESGVIRCDTHPPVMMMLVQELRAFSETAELHLTRRRGLLSGRYREDGCGAAAEFVDSAARLWGKKEEVMSDGFIRLLDVSRKIELVLPVADGQARSYELVTRNYIGYADTGQAGYCDWRMVKVNAVREAK